MSLIIGSKELNNAGLKIVKNIRIANSPVTIALIDEKQREFLPSKNKNSVLIKKIAFSCNYRDKSIALDYIQQAKNKTQHPEDEVFFCYIGSDFVGKVIEVGESVKNLKKGDRVIPNGNFPFSKDDEVPGIPSNSASRKYEIYHQNKLVKIPGEMPDEVAAAFTIGAQTSYSIVRRLNLQKGDNLLVTAAKSNTAIFVLNALKEHNVNVYCLSSNTLHKKEILYKGVKQLIQIDHSEEDFLKNNEILKIARSINGFDAIFDPFFDLHITKIIKTLGYNTKYVTCGLYNQHKLFAKNKYNNHKDDLRTVLIQSIKNNITIIGNNLGNTEDLQNAIDDYAQSKLKVDIDSVYSGTDIDIFFNRTYNDKNRFGKVVYKYQD